MPPHLARIFAVFFIALVVSTAMPSSLSAQELRGSLLVSVVDSSGAAVPAAQVTLEEKNLATHREQTTDSRGDAHFPALLPATYSVEVTANGFASQTQHIVVSISGGTYSGELLAFRMSR